MEVTVSGNLDDLVADLYEVGVDYERRGAKLVNLSVNQGMRTMRTIAKAASGPHGKAYYKRIEAHMTGLLSGEFGPHDGGVPVGGGWRHGVNTDASKAAAIVGPRFGERAARLADTLFWPGE